MESRDPPIHERPLDSLSDHRLDNVPLLERILLRDVTRSLRQYLVCLLATLRIEQADVLDHDGPAAMLRLLPHVPSGLQLRYMQHDWTALSSIVRAHPAESGARTWKSASPKSGDYICTCVQSRKCCLGYLNNTVRST